MSTRSRIGIVEPDGSVKSIYCHSDGYPEGVGQCLASHWTQDAKIRELIDLGDISSIGTEIGEKHEFDRGWEKHPDWVRAYGRDRGEADVGARAHDGVEAFYASCTEDWSEHAYLWRDGGWWHAKVGGGAGPLLVTADDPDGTNPANWRPLGKVLATVD